MADVRADLAAGKISPEDANKKLLAIESSGRQQLKKQQDASDPENKGFFENMFGAISHAVNDKQGTDNVDLYGKPVLTGGQAAPITGDAVDADKKRSELFFKSNNELASALREATDAIKSTKVFGPPGPNTLVDLMASDRKSTRLNSSH